MKKLLITGFEPFGGEDINPSWEAVKRLPDIVGKYELIKTRIPVSFADAAKLVISKANEIGADMVICIGQAGGRDAITPEFVGINLRYAPIPDNNDFKPCDEPITMGGANAYFSTLPVRDMVDAINNAGVLSKVSYSAGTYVCNDVLYSLLSYFDGTCVKSGFIHVPYCTDQLKTPSMSLDDITKAICASIEAID